MFESQGGTRNRVRCAFVAFLAGHFWAFDTFTMHLQECSLNVIQLLVDMASKLFTFTAGGGRDQSRPLLLKVSGSIPCKPLGFKHNCT